MRIKLGTDSSWVNRAGFTAIIIMMWTIVNNNIIIIIIISDEIYVTKYNIKSF